MNRVITISTSLLVFTSLASGCGGPKSQVADEPFVSKLAGRWTVLYSDLIKTQAKTVQSQHESNRDDSNVRMLYVTVFPDGSIDWTRSFLGVATGLHELRNVGDKQSPMESVEYEMLAAEYALHRTRVRFRRTFKAKDGGETRPDEIGISIESLPDGSAQLEVEEQGRSGQKPPLKLTRHDPQRLHLNNQSRIAGKWSLTPGDKQAVLIIRPDGTFNWIGTAEAAMGMFYQLESQGDQAFAVGQTTLLELVSAKYTPDSSENSIRQINSDGTSYFIELSARRIDDQRIEVNAKSVDNDRVKSGNRILCRNDDAQFRVDGVFRTLWDESEK